MAEYIAAPTRPGQSPAPLPTEGVGSLDWWKRQIAASEEHTKKYAEVWKQNVSRQTGTPLDRLPTTDTVVISIDHANIEQKKAQLYFRNPDVQLIAAPGHDASADALQAFSAVLNEYLGPDGVDAETMADELLTDVLCPSGIGFSVLGIETTVDGTMPMEVGTREVPQVGAVLNLQPVQEPILEEVPNIIHQAYFWSRVSPLCGLFPPRFHGSNFDRAPWLGYKFEMDRAIAMRALSLTDAEADHAGDMPDRLNRDAQTPTRHSDVVYGYCLSYKGSLYNPAVIHPEEIWRLILIKGVDRVVTHDRPYQRYSGDGTLMGLRGHFLHVYTPRYVSDSAIPPSDVSMSRQQVGELQKGRTQMLLQRDRAKPMRWLDINAVDPAIKDKVERGQWQDIILTTRNGADMMGEIAAASFPRENFTFNDIVTRDIDRAWGFGDTQRGLTSESKRTATELSIQTSSSDTRMEKERTRLLKWYLRGAEKLAGLIQLFEDDRTTVQIAGEANATRIVEWKKDALPIRFQATANLDTMLRVDTARRNKDDLDTYQMTANDPHVNRVELVTQIMRRRGYDVSKVIVQELPPKGPEPPKLTFTITGEDVNPAMPQFPLVLEILAAGGIQITPENIALGLALAQKAAAQGGAVDPSPAGVAPVTSQPEPDRDHGGPAEQAEPLSKRSGDQTGKLSGMGMAQVP